MTSRAGALTTTTVLILGLSTACITDDLTAPCENGLEPGAFECTDNGEIAYCVVVDTTRLSGASACPVPDEVAGEPVLNVGRCEDDVVDGQARCVHEEGSTCGRPATTVRGNELTLVACAEGLVCAMEDGQVGRCEESTR